MLNKFYSTFILIQLTLAFFVTVQAQQSSAVFNIKNYGAKGDGKTVNTQAINKAIEACAQAGGGTVVVPAGTFLTGTIHMKSHMTLLLEKGAIIKGVTDLDAYVSYIPTPGRDMARYDNAYKTRWNRALILGVGVCDVTITGTGIVDGDHVFDAQGEERMRGPHTILFAESRNLTFSGFTVNNSANYAFLGYETDNVLYSHLTINQGWDGIHVRGGKNNIIRNSSFYTGDDAIAGGYWEDMVITDCHINSSCNGIRVIMPADGFIISHCTFAGPGLYPHRTSGERNRKNMGSAFYIQPGGWCLAPGIVDRVHVYDITISNTDNPFAFTLHQGNSAGKILIERVKAEKINNQAISVDSRNGGTYDEIIFRDMTIDYIGRPSTPPSADAAPRQNAADARITPWGFSVRNVKNIAFENVEIKSGGTDSRPAFLFENVFAVKFNGVKYPGKDNQETVVFRSSGTWHVDNKEVIRSRR